MIEVKGSEIVSISQKRHRTMDLTPANVTEAIELSKFLASSNMVPKQYVGQPQNVLVAMQMGAEIGLAPMQAMQHIAVINGKPALYGDAALAVVKAHPQCVDVIEQQGDTWAECTVMRKNCEPVVRTFTQDDAKRAGLLNRQGPWQQYPQRMLQMRARSFALRDAFPDALAGLGVVEEVQDIPVEQAPEKEVQAAEKVVSVDEQIVAALAPESKPGNLADKLKVALNAIETHDDANALQAELREGGSFHSLDVDIKRDARKEITRRVKEMASAG